SNAPPRSSTAATGNAATATATGSKDASPSSSAKSCAAPAYEASKAHRPGSAASASPTTCSESRSSPDQHGRRPPRQDNPPAATSVDRRSTVFQGEVALEERRFPGSRYGSRRMTLLDKGEAPARRQTDDGRDRDTDQE